MPLRWFDKHHSVFNLFYQINPIYYIKEETAIYLTHTIKFLALALIGVYVPVYIYVETKGIHIFSPDDFTNGIMWLLVYFGIKVFTILVGIVIFAPLIFSRINFQRSLIISSIFLAGHIYFLILGEGKPLYIMFSGFLSAFEVPFYWIPYHLLFIHKLRDRSGHFGQKTGMRFFLVNVASAVSPLLGGLIIKYFGFPTLFITTILLLIFSNIPILTLVHEWKHHKHTINNVLKNFCFNTRYKYITLSFFGQAVEAIILSVFWPILLFIIFKNFVEIGFLNSLSLLISSVTLLVVGKWLDSGKSKIVHGIGVNVATIINLLRAVIITPIGIFILSIIDNLNSPLYSLPNLSLVYDKAKKLGSSELIIYREIVIHAFILLFIIMLLLVMPVTGNWKLLFIPAALGSLLAYSINFDEN